MTEQHTPSTEQAPEETTTPEQTPEQTEDNGTRTRANAEAAKWRKQLREVEAERDQLRADLATADRRLWAIDKAGTLKDYEATIILDNLDQLTGDTDEQRLESVNRILFDNREKLVAAAVSKQSRNFFGGAGGTRQLHSGGSDGGGLTNENPSWGQLQNKYKHGAAELR